MRHNFKKRAIVAAMLLFLSSSIILAEMSDKLHGHWAKNMLKESTVIEYFPKLAENAFEKLAPAKAVSMSETISALNLLYTKYEKELLPEVPPKSESFPRKEILALLAPALKSTSGQLPESLQPLLFQDCDSLNDNEKQMLKLLNERKIINGSAKYHFSPKQNMTQAEVILLLQRVELYLKNELSNKKMPSASEIAFQTIKQSTNYNDREGLVISETGDTILLTITKQFSTPGYSLAVRSLIPTEKGIKVELNISSPPADAILAQVITYQTITIKINKSDLPAATPILFLVEGIRSEIM